MSPVGFLILICMSIVMCFVKSRNALIPLLITTCYMPLGQMFVVAGLHFPLFRVLLLVGWCRVLIRREHSELKLVVLDKIFIWWSLTSLVFGILVDPSVDRFINRSGQVYDAIGAYFLIRCWLTNMDGLVNLVRFLSWMILPLAISMIVEKNTGRNIFSVFGGVNEITSVREGSLRCQGAFRHAILAGTYGATLFPLFAGLWLLQDRGKWLAIMGMAGSTVITIASASSGPLIAWISVWIGFALWYARYSMRWFRRGIVLILILLALVMKAPVWFLIARISDVLGGTGWHRAYLIDQAVKHFGEWWLVGSVYTAHWAPAGQVLAVDPNNMDITNHYVLQGLEGGIWKLGLFLAMIVRGFKTVGKMVLATDETPVRHRIFYWSLGVCLTAHCISFISVSYFDQIVIMWYWLLACVAMLPSNRVDRFSFCSGSDMAQMGENFSAGMNSALEKGMTIEKV